jgi:hypothetical protein
MIGHKMERWAAIFNNAIRECAMTHKEIHSLSGKGETGQDGQCDSTLQGKI